MLKTGERISVKFVKHIREGVYEMRAASDSNIYLAFFIFDDGNIVILFNGFQKKTQKTPKSEIRKAIELKKRILCRKTTIFTAWMTCLTTFTARLAAPSARSSAARLAHIALAR